MVSLVWLIVGYVLGWCVGYGLSVLCRRKNCAGTLREDRSDPDEAPYLFLELDPDGMKKIRTRRTVSFKVRLENYLPRN